MYSRTCSLRKIGNIDNDTQIREAFECIAEYQRVLHAQPLVISRNEAPFASQSQVGDRTSKETKTEQKQIIIVRLKEGKKGNNPGTRQEPLRIQVNNNCSKYCDSFHLWP